jgi:hypothetical protein
LILGNRGLESLKAFFNARELRKGLKHSSQFRWIDDRSGGLI